MPAAGGDIRSRRSGAIYGQNQTPVRIGRNCRRHIWWRGGNSSVFLQLQFEDSIQEEALPSTYGTKTEDAIRDAVFKKAQDLEIPLTREQIKVQRTGSGQGSGTVSIEADYSVHVDLPGYPLDLHFAPSSRNKGVF